MHACMHKRGLCMLHLHQTLDFQQTRWLCARQQLQLASACSKNQTLLWLSCSCSCLARVLQLDKLAPAVGPALCYFLQHHRATHIMPAACTGATAPRDHVACSTAAPSFQKSKRCAASRCYSPITWHSGYLQDGNTPLHLAAAGGHTRCAQLLMGSRNSDQRSRQQQLQLRNAAGYTPLMAAAAAGHAQVVDVMLLAGADMHSGVLQVRRNRILCCKSSVCIAAVTTVHSCSEPWQELCIGMNSKTADPRQNMCCNAAGNP